MAVSAPDISAGAPRGGAGLVVSVHLADPGMRMAAAALRHPPTSVPGLLWSTAAAPLAIGHVPPRPLPGRLGLVAAWDSDRAVDAVLAEDPWGHNVAAGYHARFEVMCSFGSWSAFPALEVPNDRGTPDEPVGVLTLGRLKPSRAVAFLRASARAERPLLAQPDLLAAVGLARPPFLATFSLWRTSAAMRGYAAGSPGSGHASAVASHLAKPFHRESIFVRLRPYRSAGRWKGRDPLAGVALPAVSRR